MKEVLVTGKTLPEAYHRALLELATIGEIVDCADWNTTQKEVSMTMVVEEPLAEPRISKLFIGGPEELEQYRQEMLYGILDFEISKGNWKYTYHDRMANYNSDNSLAGDQIKFVIEELKRNSSSRRAVIVIRKNSDDMYSDDPACLQHIQYFIRNNKLDCTVLFRSNDACKATFMNAFALICLQEKIANELGIAVGTYTHRANSFHCYEKDCKLLKSYADKIQHEYFANLYKSPEKQEHLLVYSYEDDWKELMDDFQAELNKKVEKLKHG